MFSIFRSSVKFPIAELIQTDIHSHILPGIDDGAQNVEVSLRLVRGLKSLGFKRLIASPHVYLDVYPNNKDTVSKAFSMLKEEMATMETDIDVSYGAEYMMDENFEILLEEKDLLTLGERHILIETPFLTEPPHMAELIFRVKTATYQPILAHPERYHFMFGNIAKAEDLRDRGAFLQINALSLLGYYGKREKDTAFELLKEGLVDFIGTDLHHERHLAALTNYSIDRKIVRLLEKIELKNTKLETNEDR